MECHKCLYSKRIHAGEYADTPWEQTPCSACTLTLESSHVPYRENVRGEGDGPAAHAVKDDIEMPLSVLAEALSLLFEQPEGVLCIIRMRVAGAEFGEIAARMGLKRSTVEMRLWRAVRKQPALGALFLGRFKKRGIARKDYLRVKCATGRGRSARAFSDTKNQSAACP